MVLSHPFDKLRTGPFPSKVEGLRKRFPSPPYVLRSEASRRRGEGKGEGDRKKATTQIPLGKNDLYFPYITGRELRQGSLADFRLDCFGEFWEGQSLIWIDYKG